MLAKAATAQYDLAGTMMLSSRHRIILGLFAAASLTIIFLLNYNFIVFHFCGEGAYVTDSSWLGSLGHEPALLLKNPLILQKDGHTPFFYATHFAAIYVLIGSWTHLIATNTIYFAAIHFASVYTFLCAVIVFLIWKNFEAESLRWPTWAMLIVIATAPLLLFFSGPVLSAVGYPHYEFLIGTFGALLFYCIGAGRYNVAALVGLLAILTREDAGLHLFQYFLVWVFYLRHFRSWTLRDLRPWLVAMTAVLGGSIALFIIQKTVFPGDSAATQSYFGTPAYAHITVAFLKERVVALLANARPLMVCMAATAILSGFTRDLRYILGYVAGIPWIVFSVLAVRDAPGILSLYYQYPFVLALLWPLLVMLLPDSPSGDSEVPNTVGSKPAMAVERRATLAIILVLVGYLASTFVYSRRYDFNLMVRSMLPVPVQLQASVLSLQGMILGGMLTRELIGADDAVASLAPKAIRYEQRVMPDQSPLRFRAVALNSNYFDAARLIEKLVEGGYQQSYRIGVSTYFVAINPSVEGDEIAKALQAEAGGGVNVFEQSYLYTRQLAGPMTQKLGPFLWAGSPGLIAHGPYIRLNPSRYKVEYTVSAVDCAAPKDSLLDVVIVRNGQSVLNRKTFALDVLKMRDDCSWKLPLTFTVDSGDGSLLGFAIWLKEGKGGIVVRNISLLRQ